MNRPTPVVFCNCTHADVLPSRVKHQVLRKLNASGVAFEAVADLCEMSARKDPAMKRLAAAGEVKIAACFPRAVEWLFQAAGAPLTNGRWDVFNMREQSEDEIVAGLLSDRPTLGEPRP